MLYEKLDYLFQMYDFDKNGGLDYTEIYWLVFGIIALTGNNFYYYYY